MCRGANIVFFFNMLSGYQTQGFSKKNAFFVLSFSVGERNRKDEKLEKENLKQKKKNGVWGVVGEKGFLAEKTFWGKKQHCKGVFLEVVSKRVFTSCDPQRLCSAENTILCVFSKTQLLQQ